MTKFFSFFSFFLFAWFLSGLLKLRTKLQECLWLLFLGVISSTLITFTQIKVEREFKRIHRGYTNTKMMCCTLLCHGLLISSTVHHAGCNLIWRTHKINIYFSPQPYLAPFTRVPFLFSCCFFLFLQRQRHLPNSVAEQAGALYSRWTQ